ncbi:MAG TPA: complex I NDUFA9 subunit family protein [Usitatibacteraceae bacterium]|nr:complex I NDUFA9 subunit family protein [Usitatibacteraceae bacterium]
MNVVLFGGSGFIGSAVAAQLAAQGHVVTVPTRVEARARHLSVLPTVSTVECNIADPAALARLLEGADAVVNLVGILHGDFESAHVRLPEQIAMAAAAARVSRMVQMSALAASITGPSAYLQSRERGEAAVARVAAAHPGLSVTILQPSVVFGEGDKFLNMFAALAKVAPVIPLGSPSALFQPVWVGDVARAVRISIENPACAGRTYPLAGPRVYTLRELVELAMTLSGHRRPIIGLPPALTLLQAWVFEHLPGRLITRDNVRSMQVPNTSPEPFPAVFGSAHALEPIAASYLCDAQLRDGYAGLRQLAGR